MDSAKHRKRDTARRLVMAFICPALLLLLNAVCSAQTSSVTPKPDTYDPAKPQSIVLNVTTDGKPDEANTKKVNSVTVGDKLVTIQKDEKQGIITLTNLPNNLTGPQAVKLFERSDGMGAPLTDQVTLTYPATNSVQTEARPEGWLRSLIGIAFLIVLGAFVYTIAKSILRSRATFRSQIGMPVGSFRAIIAYTLVAFLGFFVLNSILAGAEFKPPDALLGIVATVIGFYFGTRSGEEGGLDARAGTVRGIVRKDGLPASGALVKFKRSADGTEPYTRITDVDGRFDLRGVRPDKYKVSATLTGAPPSAEQEINVAEGSDHEIAIEIKSAAPPPPTTGSVQGTVKKDGKATAGATVELKVSGVTKGKPATTNEKGEYKIDVAPGTYDVIASLPGATPTDKPLTATGTAKDVTAGATQIVDLDLKPTA